MYGKFDLKESIFSSCRPKQAGTIEVEEAK
jgi:hypothetical protein